MSAKTEVTCKECNTLCGGARGKDTYKHMINCLKVEPDAYPRIRELAVREWGERGRRVIHLLDALEAVDSYSAAEDY